MCYFHLQYQHSSWIIIFFVFTTTFRVEKRDVKVSPKKNPTTTVCPFWWISYLFVELVGLSRNNDDDTLANADELETSQTLKICFVRKWGSDDYTINIQNRVVSSKLCRYMSGTVQERRKPNRDRMTMDTMRWKVHVTFYAIIGRTWIFGWKRTRSFLFVPTKLNIGDTRLCPTAKKYFGQGYSLLLFVGEKMVLVCFLAWVMKWWTYDRC